MLSLLLLIYVDTLKYRSIVFQNLKYTQNCYSYAMICSDKVEMLKKKNLLPIVTGKYI